MRGREELVLRVYVDHRAPSHVTLMPLELFSEYGQVLKKKKKEREEIDGRIERERVGNRRAWVIKT